MYKDKIKSEMKRNKLKWLMSLAVMLALVPATAQTTVKLTFQNAATQEIDVNTYGKIYFSNNYMYIDDGTAIPYSFAVSNIRKMEFEEVAGVQDFTTGTFKVYPNPAHNELYISGNEFGPYRYFLYSTDGRLLRQGEVQDGDPINISDIPSGLYILKINNKSLKISKL